MKGTGRGGFAPARPARPPSDYLAHELATQERRPTLQDTVAWASVRR